MVGGGLISLRMVMDDYSIEFSLNIGEAPERILAPSKFTTCGILTWAFGNVDIG